jgi:hypothetical protein
VSHLQYLSIHAGCFALPLNAALSRGWSSRRQLLHQQPNFGPGLALGQQSISTTCSSQTGMIISVTCLLHSKTKEVLDLRLESTEGGTTSLCDTGDIPGTTQMVYNLAPGDQILNMRVCSRAGGIAGIVFSAAGGALECGEPDAAGAVCVSTTTTQPAPMSAVAGQCTTVGGIRGLTAVTQVCFNSMFVSPTIPITGEECGGYLEQSACHVGSSCSTSIVCTTYRASKTLLVWLGSWPNGTNPSQM